MRISSLAKSTGTSIATLKFYLRGGLIPPGERTAPNQAEYGDEHVRRVRLVRALTEVGGLPLEATRRVLSAVDDPDLAIHEVFGVAQDALRARDAKEPDAESELADKEVDDYLRNLGWRVKADAAARRDLAAALLVLRNLGWQVDARVFDPYARAADEVARWEIEQIPSGEASSVQSLENVVVGITVFETVLSALRQLAQEHHSAARFG